MKKVLIAAILFFSLTTMAVAQTTAPAKKDAKAKTMKSADKTTTTKSTKVVNMNKPATSTGAMKKDGTPDMRYKANKDTKPAGPLKKDGTPDMRYKANKTAAKKAA